MRKHAKEARNNWRNLFVEAAAIAVLGLIVTLRLSAQAATNQAPNPQSPRATDRPAFDVASIKIDNSGSGRRSLSLNLPGGRIRAINVSLAGFMTAAYQIPASRIVGAPAWFDSETFDVEAISEASTTFDQNRLRLQSLLADRFKLAMHYETRQLPVYTLVLAKPGKLGPQLHLNDEKCGPSPAPSLSAAPAATSSTSTPSSINCGDISGATTPGRVRILARGVTMNKFLVTLAGSVSNPYVDRPIVDRTGLIETVNITLEFAPLQLTASSTGADASAPPPLFTAIEEQLGLKLVPQTGPLDVIVIDHVEKPSPN